MDDTAPCTQVEAHGQEHHVPADAPADGPHRGAAVATPAQPVKFTSPEPQSMYTTTDAGVAVTQAPAECHGQASTPPVAPGALLVPWADGSWGPLPLHGPPVNPFHAFVLSRCPLSEHDSFFSLWALFQQHQAQTFMVHTPFGPQGSMRLPAGMGPDRGGYRPPPPSVMRVPVPLPEHPDDARQAVAMDPTIVSLSKRMDIPRHLSARDIATGGLPRPPPSQLGWGADAPVVVVPMSSDLALRLSGLVPPEAHGFPMTGAPVPLPLPTSVCGRRSPWTEDMGDARSRSARTSASTQSDYSLTDDTVMAPGSGGLDDDGRAPCYLWRQLGMCNRPQCRFAHGRVVGQEPQMVDLAMPLRICHFHVPGSLFSACKKGNTCEFLHL